MSNEPSHAIYSSDHIQTIALKHAQQIQPSDACLPPHVVEIITQNTATKSLFGQLPPVENQSDIQVHQSILVFEASLRSLDLSCHDSSFETRATTLKKWVINAILPSDLWAIRPQIATENSVLNSPDAVRLRYMNIAGLYFLSQLEEIMPTSESDQLLDLIVCLASFTDQREPWSSPKASHLATSFITHIIEAETRRGPQRLRAVFTDLLQLHVKPVFAKVKNNAITQQGRKAINPAPSTLTSYESEEKFKPWNSNKAYIISVYGWVLSQLDTSSLETNWPVIIPPLLALIDNTWTPNKLRGCELLAVFLEGCPAALLQRTGLGEVFENALTPYLLYLPTLVTETECLQILGAVYPTLIALNRARYLDDKDRGLKLKGLDRIMREGVFKGYAHVGEKVRIAEILVKQMTILIKEMGISSTKHLKYIVPVVSQILAAPFATAYSPLIEAAVQALEAIVVNVWPRVDYYRGDIFKGLITCWCKIGNEEERPSEDLLRVGRNIEKVVRLMTAFLKTQRNIADEYHVLIATNSRLRALLTI